MTEILLIVAALMLLATLILAFLLFVRSKAPRPDAATPELLAQLTALERVTGAQLTQVRTDLAQQRGELGDTLDRSHQGQAQNLDRLRETLDAKLATLAEQQSQGALAQRTEQTAATRLLADTLGKQQELVQQALVDMVLRIDKMAESLRLEAQASRKTLDDKMAALQASNEQRLEQMRQTVDEKLHATLEARLGESFKLVSERLEAVQKGLGEMKVLADGVGDLKKVMTNVKTRGTWGEVQLRAIIEDILRPEEFTTNWAPRGGGERVEFAIRLPGNEAGSEIFLPIDSKFPVEDYQRLVEAQEAADADGARVHGKALEDRIKGCAKDIGDKYLQPGVTTDFALLFLPFEGLYAEVLRRPGLVEWVQRQHHVAVCGPTTLGALLNSLRMGFRAVAIQKRSGDIGALLGAVKHEFETFGEVIDGVGRRLKQAQDDIDKVGVRTRAINRKLRDVEAVPALE
jgi:DNA recombination protein RmuC